MQKVQYYKIYGGIGNQLFQYAHGISEIKKGKNVRFILNRDFSLKVFNDLPELFTINPDLVFIPKNKFELFLAKAFAKYICKSWHTGFFQDFNFAEFIKTENIQFLKKKEYENTETASFFSKNNVISIHIRGGDYNRADVFADYGNICTKDYYTKAINEVFSKFENPIFIVFSNDKKYAESILTNIKNSEFIFADELKEKCSESIKTDPAFDMYLQTLCKSNIIANSTFSWWGAFLNETPQKLVISPSKWHNKRPQAIKEIIPDYSGWRKI